MPNILKSKVRWVFLGLLAFVFIVTFISFYYLDFLWFKSIDYSQIFTTIWVNRLVSGLGVGLIVLLILGINIKVALRYISKTEPPEAYYDYDNEETRRFTGMNFTGLHDQILSRVGRFILKALAIVVAFLIGALAADNWLIIQQFIYSTSFNLTDPIFSRDLGFYFFDYSFFKLIYQWLMQTFIVVLLIVGILYLITGGQGALTSDWKVFSFPKRHLCALIAILFLIKGFGYILDSYSILFTDGGLIYGASYTDVHARLLAYRILAGTALLMAVIIITNMFINRLLWIVYWGVAWVVLAIILSGVYPAIIQKLVVQPNEFNKETVYLEHSIDYTQRAYNLDNIDHREFKINYNLTVDDLENNAATVDNIRLWDWQPLLDTYKSLQELRLYYIFNDIDIDRYTIDGLYRQVMLSVREMEDMNRNQAISPEAKTWVNQRLMYTHGYGVTASPVNEVAQEGFPRFFIKDIPPQFSTDLVITRPEIYFGERTDSYVIVNTKQPEFDYPMGEQNVSTIYSGEKGLKINSFFRRIMLAWELGDYKLLLSSEVTNDSQILMHRNIVERVYKLAPYLYLDEDPYIVIRDNGELCWMLDAYTYSDRYPYSQPFEISGYNYLRNSAKIVVNTYTGDVDFYISDNNDPMIMTYSKIFADMYQPLDNMPEDLRKHLRYPEFIFEVQANIYKTFHMADPWVFYNKEDSWVIPNEIVGNKEQVMDPYYLITRLPGELQEEYIIMLPFTPNSRPNLNAWMCARMDGDNYGKIIEYRFPKQETVYGPMQIESRINQNTEISQQLTLWSQGGSSVYRGNLLIIPIEDSLLYIEPLYLQADQSRMPELKRVIVSYGDNLVMEISLDAALTKIFGAAPQTPISPDNLPSSDNNETITELSTLALQYFNQAEAAAQRGDWASYGRSLEQLKNVLNRMQ